jgi:hypothetical protein
LEERSTLRSRRIETPSKLERVMGTDANFRRWPIDSRSARFRGRVSTRLLVREPFEPRGPQCLRKPVRVELDGDIAMQPRVTGLPLVSATVAP